MADSLLQTSSIILSNPSRPTVLPLVPTSPSGSPQSRKLTSEPAAPAALFARRPRRSSNLKVHAAIVEPDRPKWWEKNAGPNMIDVHSTEEFLSVLCQAGDKLVIVEFYGTWCASCRALFPRLCRMAKEHPDVLFAKVDYHENKPMCKRLNVKVLPFFHFYRGADGLLESFTCSLAKFRRLTDAMAKHNTARCSIGPPAGLGHLKDLLEAQAHRGKTAGAGGDDRMVQSQDHRGSSGL